MDLNALLYHHQIALLRRRAHAHKQGPCLVTHFHRRITARLERDGADMRLTGSAA